MSVLLALIVLIVGLLIWNTYKRRTYFKKLGLPGPPPLPLFGNILSYGMGMHETHEAWAKKYGRTYGVFEGARKAIITSDPDMIQEVLVKKFKYFCDRQSFPLRPELMQNDLLSLKGDRWRLMRSTVAPTFSKSKMQKMASLVMDRADVLLKNVERRCSQGKNNIELSKMLGSFVIESGSMCAFATEVDSQNSKDTTFVDNAVMFFKGFREMQLPWMIILMLPWTEPIFKKLGFSIHPVESVDFFKGLIMDILHSRRSDPQRQNYVDFLQLIMNAHNFQDEDTPEDERVDVDNKRALTLDEVTAMAIALFLANYETTTTALCFTTYLLATHPEVQECLIAEIDDVIGDRTTITYEDTARLPYMDMVVHEALRMYPPAIEFDRICQEDCVIRGIPIPKGTMLEIPVWAVHHDPDVWPEPYRFDPERFTAENRAKRHPFAWLGFGEGPRKCIGYRFAQMEMPLVIIRLLQKFRVEPCEETEIPPKLGKYGLLLTEAGVTVRFVPRNK